ncbi:TPA: hypothetical protein NPP60_004941 [Klebsiella variicola subsp. variicola]|nr:hypothetical protein [Klebsiella variicola subsp. variicola]
MKLLVLCLILAFCVLSMAHAGTDHTIASKSFNGVITLEDGSVWASETDLNTSSIFWVAGDSVILADDETELFAPADESYISVVRVR